MFCGRYAACWRRNANWKMEHVVGIKCISREREIVPTFPTQHPESRLTQRVIRLQAGAQSNGRRNFVYCVSTCVFVSCISNSLIELCTLLLHSIARFRVICPQIVWVGASSSSSSSSSCRPGLVKRRSYKSPFSLLPYTHTYIYNSTRPIQIFSSQKQTKTHRRVTCLVWEIVTSECLVSCAV